MGTGTDVTIRELTELVARVVGFTGRIVWDTSKPNGQPRRKLKTDRAVEAFGFRSTVDFATGLRRTIEWYRSQRARGLV